jgi:hypothetical protein
LVPAISSQLEERAKTQLHHQNRSGKCKLYRKQEYLLALANENPAIQDAFEKLERETSTAS